ncbi:MAG TPA: M20/M25/M40 family metallo-hydrolase [Candidatus Limnocylindria bacterium]
MSPALTADAGEAVRHLVELIRIPSVNPPGDPATAAGRDSTGGETAAARYCAEVLTAAGIPAEVLEAQPGRGSCFARLRADPAVADPEPPLVLLSHVDVVPVDADAWSRDPFGGELVDGVVWGRGAVDMKQMVAMELAVMVALHRSAIPLRRDVIFAAVADEEAGGSAGAQHWVETRPDLFGSDAGPAAAALNEIGGYSMTVGGRRVYAIQVAEKGIIWTRLHATGTPGHGSMPHAANPTIHLAEAVARLAAAPPTGDPPAVVRSFFAQIGLGEVADLVPDDRAAARATLEQLVTDPTQRRSFGAMLQDTVTPTVLRSGSKVNVIPASGMAEVDVRTLPATDQAAFAARLQALAGDEVTVEAVMSLPAVEADPDAPIVHLMRAALGEADPDAVAVPMLITPGTDAKALAKLEIPTYGFCPLRLEANTPFLDLFHGNDERVPVSAIEFGVPVLEQVVRTFSAAERG